MTQPTCETCSKYARKLLLSRIREISEEVWCAGWFSGIENDLWLLAIGKGEPKLYGDVGPELMDLARVAGGWWHYGSAGPEFVLTKDWFGHQPAQQKEAE
jgi:hypothetical protein